LTSCLTTSGAPIGDKIVAFCTQSISRKSYETARPNAEQKLLHDSKPELGAFYPQRSTRVKIISSSITRLLVIYLQTRFCHTLAVLYSRSRTSVLYFMLKIVCVRRVQRYISVTSPTSST